jgi:hypothetical protein
MTGGILNLISYGSENVILNGNPTTTFFKGTYSKYTNFGLQKFRIDYEGQRQIQTGTRTRLEFKVPRYADLLWDTYLVVTLPDIYSSAYFNQEGTNSQGNNGSYVPYDFRWIDELGTTMIEEIEVVVGNATLARYSGEYLSILNSRDSTEPRKQLWNKMTGNIPELNNPAFAEGRQGIYPSVVYLENEDGNPVQPEPSIRRTQLVVPLEPWFGLSSKQAFPLVAVQNNEMSIRVHLRPVDELFRVRNVIDPSGNFDYISPNQNRREFAIQRFLYPPTDPSLNEYNGVSTGSSEFLKMPDTWNADIHIIGTYVFLSEEERQMFARREHKYLIRDVFETDFNNIFGSKMIELDARDCVAHFIWRFRRTDAAERNEWSNYTNWKYRYRKPHQPVQKNPYSFNNAPPDIDPFDKYYTDQDYQESLRKQYRSLGVWGGTVDLDEQFGALHTQLRNSVEGIENQKNILLDLGIVLDGKYREKVLPTSIYQYIEPYARGNNLGGTIKEGIYHYSFGTSMDRYTQQPNGAMNLNNTTRIQFELNTITPPINPESRFEILCEQDEDGTIFQIGTRQNVHDQYMYTYNMRVFEERYNVVHVVGGNVALMFAR